MRSSHVIGRNYSYSPLNLDSLLSLVEIVVYKVIAFLVLFIAQHSLMLSAVSIFFFYISVLPIS
jgi:hypothetical protein